MLPGPVFHAELITTARRPRYYAIRFLYGAILLFFIWQNDPGIHAWYYPGAADGMSIAELARLGRMLFTTFLTVQGLAVLVLTPALVAGVIAEERQRKTLHYLLASRLSSSEIVLGKLAARSLHLAVFLAIGLPVTSLISLFGGVEPALVVVSFAATISTAFFLAALSILVSTHSRRPREAISLAYMLAMFWLFVPTLLRFLLPRAGPEWVRIYEWVRPVNDWIAPSSPFAVLSSLAGFGATAKLLDPLLWMVGLQLVYGVLFVAIAVLRLRPVGQKEGGGAASAWIGLLGRKQRIFPRPECGEDAMLWKELYVSRMSVTTKVTASLVVAAVLIGLGYVTYDFAKPAFVELRAYGYGSAASSRDRGEFNGYLRAICTMIYMLWAIGVASASSSGMTGEREGDTWVSLMTTPLGGSEIVRAKMIGAVWGLRWVAAPLLALWLLGLAAGSIHPLGLLAVLIETAVFLWFASALGTYLSLRSRSSGRSLLATIATLFVINGAILLCCIPFRIDSWLLLSVITPLIEAYSLASYDEIGGLLSGQVRGNGPYRDADGLLASFVGTLIYVVAAAALTQRCLARFDVEADRPRRPRGTPVVVEDADGEDVGDEDSTGDDIDGHQVAAPTTGPDHA